VTAAGQGDDGRASRVRVTVTAAATLLVVVAEFLLLSFVYRRVQPIEQAQLAVAGVSGELRSASAGQLPELARSADAAATQAARAGASASAVAAVRAAANRRGGSASAQLAELRASTTALHQSLDAGHDRLDTEAYGSYAVLLVLASLGWMVWFRRLVGRHRALQAAFTAQQSQAAGERRLAALVSNSADVVAVCEADTTINYVTSSVRSVLGYPAEKLIGTKLTRLVHPSDLDVCLQQLASLGLGVEENLSLKLWHADGRVIQVEGVLSNRLADESVSGLTVTMRDVTERRELEDRLSFQALHDSLTGMPNRHLFSDRLDQALIRRPGVSLPLVVVLCDLDDFKAVNDSAGHGVGDQVLIEVARRLQLLIRAGDTVARLSADEFAILMDGADVDMATELGEQLRRALLPPVVVGDHAIRVQASLGLAQATPGEQSAEEVLRNADVAMYLAKESGKSGLAVYEPRRHSEALQRLELRADLQRALTRSELVLHYQPTVDLASGRVAGFEALVRWQHPDRGLLGPNTFIPIAEESGLIVPLGSWVLREAAQAAAGMQRIGVRPTMSVNVSSQQLVQPNFVDFVLDTLAGSGLPSDRLVLEITETVVLQDLDRVAPRLAELRQRGVRIAIDDFGTGYSSLAYLSQLPVDVLKVDKSFIDKVTIDRHDASLAEAIISLSHSMNFTTVAEGVELKEQASWLLEARCDYGQGYLWSKPVELASAQRLLVDGVPLGPLAVVPPLQVVPDPGPRDDATPAGAA